MSKNMLLLHTLVFFLWIMVPCQCIVDPASLTLAIIQETSTICGITAGSQNHSIRCTRFQDSAKLNASVLRAPTISFDSISGGQNFMCGLRSGDTSFFCWEGIHQRIKRVYKGPMLLRQISVGARHVAAIDGDGMMILWWRYGCNRHSRSCLKFPRVVYGEYHSLTSGDHFTCAINTSNRVSCWGPHGLSIETSFGDMQMRSVTAGGGRMCGMKISGNVICSGKQSIVPSGEAFELTSLATGSSHTCAIRRKNKRAVCWDQYGSYFPMGNTKFEYLVAGGNLTCGLKADLNAACWGLNGRNRLAVNLSMPKILPGSCQSNKTFCSCGVYPGSWNLCGRSGVICQISNNCPRIEMKQTPSQVNGGLYAIFVVALILATFFIGVVVIGRPQWLKIRKEEDQSTPTDLTFPVMDNVRVFDFHELKIATDNFSRACRLGCGASAIMYCGRLTDGHLVAVKRFYPEAPDWKRVFNSELRTMSMICHPNVLRLIGYCTENTEALLVTEFIQNKDVHYHICPTIHTRRTDLQRNTPLYTSWKVRIKVLLGAAKGIEYLHSKITHRNITSTNILVDETWVAKISDFGLAVIQPEPGGDDVDVAAAAVWMPGYRDPQCNTNNHQSDVYSFGVVMLEVITGQVAYDATAAKVLALSEGEQIGTIRLQDLLDSRLDLPEGRQMEAIEKVAKLAKDCTKSNAPRPNIRSVIERLESAFTMFD